MASTTRRDRIPEEGSEEEQEEQQQLTQFQQTCKELLQNDLKYEKVVDGKTFGHHLHCYRKQQQQQNEKHQHGETLVLCIEDSKSENLDSDLRYLSVASRVANTTKKRCVVAFQQQQSQKEKGDDDYDQKEKRKVRMIELVSIT